MKFSREGEKRTDRIQPSCFVASRDVELWGAAAMIWAVDARGWTTYLSPEFEEFTGQTAEETRRTLYQDVIHPDDYEAVKETYWSACQAASSFWLVFRLKHKGGGWTWVLSGANPSQDSTTGAFIGFLGSMNAIDLRQPIAAGGELAPFRPGLPSPLTPPKTHLEMIADLAMIAYAAADEGNETEFIDPLRDLLDLARSKLLKGGAGMLN